MASEEPKPDFVPNYEHLPAPRGFAVDLDKANTFEYYQAGMKGKRSDREIGGVIKTGTIDLYRTVMEPGTALPWHTHQPHTSQLYWVLQGRMRTNFKDRNGEVHSFECGPEDRKVVYLPAGAYNKLESVGDETLEVLSFKENGGSVGGRLDMLAGNPDNHFDRDGLTHGLDFGPRRGQVFEKQEDAVQEW